MRYPTAVLILAIIGSLLRYPFVTFFVSVSSLGYQRFTVLQNVYNDFTQNKIHYQNPKKRLLEYDTLVTGGVTDGKTINFSLWRQKKCEKENFVSQDFGGWIRFCGGLWIRKDLYLSSDKEKQEKIAKGFDDWRHPGTSELMERERYLKSFPLYGSLVTCLLYSGIEEMCLEITSFERVKE